MARFGARALFVVAALAWATTAAADAPPADAAPAADETWLLIGVDPPNMRMEIDPVTIKDGVARLRYTLNAYRPVDGFIVVKTRPDQSYGVAAASMMAGNTIFGRRFKPVCGTPTFHGQAGKLVYVASIRYVDEGIQIGVRGEAAGASYRTDFAAAQAFVAVHYPKLSTALMQGGYEALPIESFPRPPACPPR